jgi:hypothetical protein
MKTFIYDFDGAHVKIIYAGKHVGERLAQTEQHG